MHPSVMALPSAAKGARVPGFTGCLRYKVRLCVHRLPQSPREKKKKRGQCFYA